MHVYLSSRQRLTLERAPFASGGQGVIYRVDARVNFALRLRIAKILKLHANTPDYEARIEYLCAHRPAQASLPNPDCLAWPEHCLYDQFGKFIGFLLPLIGGAIDLEHLCNFKGTVDPRYARFSGWSASSRNQRLRIARNLVDALAAMEASGEYVSTDLKPQNILVKPTAEVSLIDLDNLQISEQGALLFRATGYTDEYPPPEFYQGKVDLKTSIVDKSFERFSLAVIIYRLLFRIHPFMGTSTARDLLDAIRCGYFVGGSHRHRFSVIPPPHREFDAADPSLRQLFFLAFDDGKKAAQRPSAQEWAAVLAQLGARPTPASARHARAVWAAQHGIPTPPSSAVQGWENASIWNPYPPRRTGYQSPDLYVDPRFSGRLKVEDPVSGMTMSVVIHDIWLVYVFEPVVVGKRVLLSYHMPPSIQGVANFMGAGWLGGLIPPDGYCVRDLYATFVFRLSYHPRGASLLSKARLRPRHLDLLVEVTPFELNRSSESHDVRPSPGLPVPMGQPIALQPERAVPIHQGARLRSVANDTALRGAAAFYTRVIALRNVHSLRRPSCTRSGIVE